MNRQNAEPYHLFMLGLSLYVIAALSAQVLFQLDAEVLAILDIADFAVCLVFLADFARSLARAENRTRYLMTWGWLDFLSSLPAIDVFRWGRTARIFRILRLLRGLRAARIVTHFVMFRRAECAFWTTALIAVLVIILGSIGILQLERGAGGNIESGPAALWWSFVTVTTVGYGDHYPITGGGRALAASLMLIGIGVFGTFTAYLATHFLDDGDSSAQEAQIAELASELAEVKRLLLEGRPGELEVSPGAAPTAPAG